MSFKIINGKHFIISIAPDQVPEELKSRTLVFYLPQRDAIVLPENNNAFDLLCEIVEFYLELDDRGRKKSMDILGNSEIDKMLLDIECVLNNIIRIRRKLYRMR